MQTKNDYAKMAAAALVVFLLGGCTSNPFGDDSVSGGKRSMSGKVQLSDGANVEGIYVWLETFKLGALTDSRGQFTLTLPPPAAQGGGGGLDGAFSLYFYVANYQLGTAQVVTRGGEFVFDRGDLNAKGELNSTRSLKKFLRVQTQVDPSPVPANYQRRIGVQVTLEATVDSATVMFPSVGGLLNAVLFRSILTGEVFTFESVINGPLAKEVVGSSPRSWVLSFSLNQIPGLTIGDWEAIPYLLIAHEDVPADLLTSIAPDAQRLGPNYLKIPFRREGGRFTIIPAE